MDDVILTTKDNSDIVDPNTGCAPGVRPDVLNYEDLRTMVPFFDGKQKLVERLLRFFRIDEVNDIHRRNGYETGARFATNLVEKEFKFKLRVDNEEVLKNIAGTPFITVSNHPFGAMDGIILLHLVGKYAPDFKVIVNMFLNHISAMQPAFFAVDPSKDSSPEHKAATVSEIRHAMKHVRDGHPLGFFPAGAVSKLGWDLKIKDREWQPTMMRLIQQLKVPVVPIYFHGHNSTFFNFLGIIDWRLRVTRLPAEVLNRRNSPVHISIGEPIPVDVQKQYKTPEELGHFLRQQTYNLASIK